MIICVLGPTGVGKTKLSEQLAIKYDAIVINADAMQIYREMNIGTAKITKEEMSDVPHYLFDIKNPDEEYSVYNYQIDARKLLDQYKDRNIILVGGTGLYVKALLYNYEFEEKSSSLSYEEYSNQELYDLIKERGDSTDVHINNRRRMVSRLNSSANHGLKDEILYDKVLFIGLSTDRSELYNRIDKRVDEMIQSGLVDEVRNLYNKYGKVRSLMTGIGYKEIIEYLDGKSSLEDATKLIKKRSRHYAKRQYTWFNNQMDIHWINTNYDDFDSTIKETIDYIDEYM